MKYKNFSSDVWNAIDRAIEQELDNNPHPVAAFDADGTLWDTDLGENFFRWQIEHKVLSNLPQDPWRFYRNEKEKGSPQKAYLWLAQINQGHTVNTVLQWAEEALPKELPIFDEQKKLIEKLLKANVQVFVVTASIKWSVEPGARRLGIPSENVLGIRTEVHDGVISDKQEGFITYREGKPKELLRVTNGVRPFLASGNSPGDLELLKSATRVHLAVGATKMGHELWGSEEELRDHAEQNGWFAHEF